ncbi:MAG: cyclic nucleotide-binding domain-containing protein [Holophagales bacterium]|jgi:CRP-like cAMP-binding protein|nr:cyclic nucleotide-binding domain-containing protein [Holophagales bacterium]MBK9966024.1 cyclic nucleotide-binding domain-containing protein [Holophagales bacterium]
MFAALEGFEEFDGIELFQKLPIFRDLNHGETLRLAAICRSEKRPAGDVVVPENALGEALYVIRSGRVSADKGEGASRVHLGEMTAGDLFGEMTLVDDVLTQATVTALEDVELLVLPRGDLDALLATDPMLALKVFRSFCRSLSSKIRELQKTLAPEQGFRIERA